MTKKVKNKNNVKEQKNKNIKLNNNIKSRKILKLKKIKNSNKINLQTNNNIDIFLQNLTLDKIKFIINYISTLSDETLQNLINKFNLSISVSFLKSFFLMYNYCSDDEILKFISLQKEIFIKINNLLQNNNFSSNDNLDYLDSNYQIPNKLNLNEYLNQIKNQNNKFKYCIIKRKIFNKILFELNIYHIAIYSNNYIIEFGTENDKNVILREINEKDKKYFFIEKEYEYNEDIQDFYKKLNTNKWRGDKYDWKDFNCYDFVNYCLNIQGKDKIEKFK